MTPTWMNRNVYTAADVVIGTALLLTGYRAPEEKARSVELNLPSASAAVEVEERSVGPQQAPGARVANER